MKLRDKKTVAAEVSLYKKNAIDEGVRIAQKVDSLRESLSSLEQQRDTHLQNAKKQLDTIYSELSQKIKSKEFEIEVLETKRAALLKPLDDEWEEVNKAKIALSKRLEEINLQKHEIDSQILLITKKEQELNVMQNEVRVEVEKKQKELASIGKSLLKAQKDLQEAQNKEKAILGSIELKQLEFVKKEQILTEKEHLVDIRAHNLEIDEKFIKEEKIRLLDQRATLERALARLK